MFFIFPSDYKGLLMRDYSSVNLMRVCYISGNKDSTKLTFELDTDSIFWEFDSAFNANTAFHEINERLKFHQDRLLVR